MHSLEIFEIGIASYEDAKIVIVEHASIHAARNRSQCPFASVIRVVNVEGASLWCW